MFELSQPEQTTELEADKIGPKTASSFLRIATNSFDFPISQNSSSMNRLAKEASLAEFFFIDQKEHSIYCKDNASKSELTEDANSKELREKKHNTGSQNELVAELIRELGSESYASRKNATDRLKAMEPEILPQLQNSVEGSDLETKLRLKHVVSHLDERLQLEREKEYSKTGRSTRNLLSSTLPQLEERITTMTKLGSAFTFPILPFSIMGDSNQIELSSAQRKEYERIIEEGSKIAADPNFQRSLRKATDLHLNATTPAARELFLDIIHAKWAAKESRGLYAAALSKTKNPQDAEQAVRLLIEHMNKNDCQDPTVLVGLAVRLGADSNPAFVKAYTESGGDVEWLHLAARSYKESLSKTQPQVSEAAPGTN
ncbi:MAG: hypothetical protein K2X27_10570 [Candidatus Obscuribacterales bacterium]|nr:hypothetical protein [Candidatus Obscuribacterales bacterium]